MYKSATIYLTAWYLALVMTISLIFSGVVYHFATDALAQGLTNQQQRIYQQFPVFYGNPFFIHNNDVGTGAHQILLNLLYFNVMVLLGAGFASYWLARRTLRPIEAANEQQKRFVADASHELRTPITALKMSTEVTLLDSHASTTELRAALESNLEDASRLDRLLNTLLRLSQLESDQLRQKFVTLSVLDLVNAAVDQTNPRAKAKQISIRNHVTPEHTVCGERDSLVQLLVILLDNAIKYSHEQTEVTVSSKERSLETTVTIHDHGIGIEPGALEHVFDRFYRADQARSGNSGFGLGLSIAKQIADVHRGSITLSSTVGKGTKASLRLPRTDPTSGP